MYRPNVQMTTAMRICHRAETDVNGQQDVSFTPVSYISFGNFKAFHGSESVQSGVLGVADGGTVTMWYDPVVSNKDRIRINDDATREYEIISEPENVELRNQYLIMKVQRVVTP